MSRIGKHPVIVPAGVTVEIDGHTVKVTGPKGTLERTFTPSTTLSLEDGQVKVDRALCLLYSGETSNALSALQAIVDEDPSNATAWANLGLVYEITGSTESARDAYTHAIEADPNDEAGAKSYASQRILQLNTAGSNSQGLSGTLRDLSGTNI